MDVNIAQIVEYCRVAVAMGRRVVYAAANAWSARLAHLEDQRRDISRRYRNESVRLIILLSTSLD